MKVKKYIASSMPEAMGKIRAELGEDAVILVSKNISTGGFLGLFSKKKIEVIAAIDEQPKKKLKTKSHAAHSLPIRENQTLLSEMQELKKQLKQMKQQTNNESESLFEINQIFKKHDIRQSLIERINENLMERYEQQQLRTIPYDIQKQWTSDYLLHVLKDKKIGGFQYEKRMLNIVGPTGVGKTTTIAKIAAKAVLQDNKKVAFITTDTYRIAAIEQLKTYAELLNIPVEVAYNLQDFNEANEKFQNYELVIVDTAGRNFLDKKYVEQLNKIVNFNEEMETYLVLSLTSKYEDMRKIIRQFNQFPIEKVIFTKKDETSSYGAMVNVMDEFSLGLAYVTDGQNVPEDIVIPSIDYIVESLFEGVNDV
ncbi:flagellar biosynthesis protein FlhF [Pueribacillus sp. YX66]|uniref:flagellar biosynthesis protein FlhF n=1 Tax=Pueribacillus sp. YX66 TaxID=3229242 RepID=UPI00358D3CC7